MAYIYGECTGPHTYGKCDKDPSPLAGRKSSFTFVLVTGADISGTSGSPAPAPAPASVHGKRFVPSGFSCEWLLPRQKVLHTHVRQRQGSQEGTRRRSWLRGLSRRSRESLFALRTSRPHTSHGKYFDVLLMSGGLLRLRSSFGFGFSLFLGALNLGKRPSHTVWSLHAL